MHLLIFLIFPQTASFRNDRKSLCKDIKGTILNIFGVTGCVIAHYPRFPVLLFL